MDVEPGSPQPRKHLRYVDKPAFGGNAQTPIVPMIRMPSDTASRRPAALSTGTKVGLHLEGESQRGPFADVEVGAYPRDFAGVRVTDA